jgi:hypothetical protein
MIREPQRLARDADFRLKLRPAVKSDTVQHPAPPFLRDLLHHRQPRHQVVIRQRLEMQAVRARAVEQAAEDHARMLEQIF